MLINIPDTNKFYLYGGVAQEPLNGIAKLTVNSHTDCKWEIINPNYIDKAQFLKGRFGFNGTFYDGKFYFLFGCQMYDKMLQERTCLNEIVIFDPYSNDLEVNYPFHVPEKLFIPRKYYAGFLLGNTYFCHGGVDSNNKMLG